MRIRVATANIAGGAREENTNLSKYEFIGDLLSGVDIIGVQEVIRVSEVGNARIIRDDIKELCNSSGLLNYHHYFFPYLDSTQQSHPKKWSSKIFDLYYDKGYQILEGTGILVKQQHCVCDFWHNDRAGYALGQVIPWYSNTPTFYLGDRDTQPRTLLLVRVKIGEKFVLFCCVHLATLKEENIKRDEEGSRLATQKAIDIRAKQINWIVEYIKSYQDSYQQESGVREPIILVGDFNSEPMSSELNGLNRLNLELVPFDIKDIGYTHRKYKIIIDLIYATRKNIDGKAHIINLQELELSENERISDHNPVIAELELHD